MLTPRTEAVAYRIWGFAAPRGWRVTQRQIADAIREPLDTVSKTICAKGWQGRTLGNDPEARTEKARNMIAQRNRARGSVYDENTLDLTQLIA